MTREERRRGYLFLIKWRGDCFNKNYSCERCPLNLICHKLTFNSDGSFKGSMGHLSKDLQTKIYEIALTRYLKRYGTKADLVEYLL